jgi:hypothetical protein
MFKNNNDRLSAFYGEARFRSSSIISTRENQPGHATIKQQHTNHSATSLEMSYSYTLPCFIHKFDGQSV